MGYSLGEVGSLKLKSGKIGVYSKNEKLNEEKTWITKNNYRLTEMLLVLGTGFFAP